MSTTTSQRRLGALALAAAASLALFGCSASSDESAAADVDGGVEQASLIETADLWVKAASEGMTAAFGTVTNTGDDTVTIVSVESDTATAMELHETVEDETGQMVMREVEGFEIAAGDTLTLEPGGNHFMIMGMEAPIAAGDEVAITLTFDDGSTAELTAVGKDYEGANETYDDGEMDMDDMDMSDMGHGEGDTTEGDH